MWTKIFYDLRICIISIATTLTVLTSVAVGELAGSGAHHPVHGHLQHTVLYYTALYCTVLHTAPAPPPRGTRWRCCRPGPAWWRWGARPWCSQPANVSIIYRARKMKDTKKYSTTFLQSTVIQRMGLLQPSAFSQSQGSLLNWRYFASLNNFRWRHLVNTQVYQRSLNKIFWQRERAIVAVVS